MGSATESNAKPQVAMAESDRKSLKKLLKVFFKKDKKKEKPKEEAFDPKATSAQTVENILEKIKQLDIKKEVEEPENDDELLNFSYKQVKDDVTAERSDSLLDFSFKQVKDDVGADRSTSHSSDSGYSEKYVPDSDDEKEREDDVIDSFKQLNIEDVKKEKKFKTVVLPRGPIRKQSELSKQTGPYYLQHTDNNNCRQIQINKHTLTGGQVTVNPTRLPDSLEFDNAFQQVQQSSQYSQHEHGGDWLNIVTEVIQDEFTKSVSVEDILSEFLQKEEMQNDSVILTPPHQPPEKTMPNAIEEFSNHIQYEMFGDLTDLTNLNDLAEPPAENNPQYFLTPPHSNDSCSPMSDSASYKNSEYTYSPERSSTLSPERSSPICNSDYEKFQEIGPYDDLPAVTSEKKCRERKDSSSSMTMKQYKDLQKEISLSFSKKECCSLSRKTCKQIFQEYMQRLDSKDRKSICFKVALLDLKDAYGVLQNVLISLSQGSEMEDLQLSLFCLISERVLAQQPAWFVDDFGLNLLKSATLRCPNRPTIARYLVHCIRQAVRNDSALVQGRETVFHEVDALGDTLVIACARRGDVCADALAEIARREPNEMPLFRVNHVNADGASALHMACSEHSATSPRLHCAHILLEHAGADLWQGDAKAGDTALHMAVNSRTCDLRLIMVIFHHLERKAWKKLAHAPNMCSTTPLENARSAMKSPTRENYPSEVLEFLKKCR